MVKVLRDWMHRYFSDEQAVVLAVLLTLPLAWGLRGLGNHGLWISFLLFMVLRSLTLAPTSALPQTGLPLELEHRLSSAFVHDPARRYGTRSTLLARLEATHPPAGTRPTLHLQEWTHDVEQPLPPGSRHWPLQQAGYSTVRRFSIPM